MLLWGLNEVTYEQSLIHCKLYVPPFIISFNPIITTETDALFTEEETGIHGLNDVAKCY